MKRLLGVVLWLASTSLASAQGAHRELIYDLQPSQLSFTYQWTVTDYSLQVSSTNLQRTTLNGLGAEYALRRFYPWEAVGTVQYSQGQPLSQHLSLAQGGVGYCRGYKQWVPFARLLAGVARTSSTQSMYLYSGVRTGFAIGMSAGADYQLSSRFGVRAIQVENQYLPFGSLGSVYWSIGAGVNYRFKK